MSANLTMRHLTIGFCALLSLSPGHKTEAFALIADGQSFWPAGPGNLALKRQRYIALGLFVVLAISLSAQERITHGDLVIVAADGAGGGVLTQYYAFSTCVIPAARERLSPADTIS